MTIYNEGTPEPKEPFGPDVIARDGSIHDPLARAKARGDLARARKAEASR